MVGVVPEIAGPVGAVRDGIGLPCGLFCFCGDNVGQHGSGKDSAGGLEEFSFVHLRVQ
jgi:hypothetical protein